MPWMSQYAILNTLGNRPGLHLLRSFGQWSKTCNKKIKTLYNVIICLLHHEATWPPSLGWLIPRPALPLSQGTQLDHWRIFTDRPVQWPQAHTMHCDTFPQVTGVLWLPSQIPHCILTLSHRSQVAPFLPTAGQQDWVMSRAHRDSGCNSQACRWQSQ